MTKICTVPTDKYQQLCPEQTIEEYNRFCEENKCPYLKEKEEIKK